MDNFNLWHNNLMTRSAQYNKLTNDKDGISIGEWSMLAEVFCMGITVGRADAKDLNTPVDHPEHLDKHTDVIYKSGH